MKYILYILFVFCGVSLLPAQTIQVIQRFEGMEAIRNLGEGYFAFRQQNKWGLKDKTGATLCNPTYDSIGDMRGGAAVVLKDGLYGLLNKKGNLVLNLKYTSVQESGDNMVVAGDDKMLYGFDNMGFPKFKIEKKTTGDWISAFNSGLAYAKIGTEEGYLDKKGKWVRKAHPDTMFSPFENGYAIFRVNPTGESGYLDPAFVPVLTGLRMTTGVVHEGFIRVSESYAAENGSKATFYGFMNLQGTVITKGKYALARDFSEGLAIVKEGAQYWAMDTLGEKTGKSYYYMESYHNGVAFIWDKERYLFVDKAGSMIFDLSDQRYSYVPVENKDSGCSFRDGYAAVAVEKYGKVEILILSVQ